MLTSAELKEYHEAEKWLDQFVASAFRQGVGMDMFSCVTLGRYAEVVINACGGDVFAAAKSLNCHPTWLANKAAEWQQHKALADRVALECTNAEVV